MKQVKLLLLSLFWIYLTPSILGNDILGKLGDKVSVKAGYGRNFLIPQGKAVAATEANTAAFEARRAELEKQEAEVLAAANARAEQLNEVFVSHWPLQSHFINYLNVFPAVIEFYEFFNKCCIDRYSSI